jgi:hypothetical protein
MNRSCTSSPPWLLHGVAGHFYFYFLYQIKEVVIVGECSTTDEDEKCIQKLV